MGVIYKNGISYGGGSGSGGTSDYEALENKPSINNVTLIGNKTAAELGIDGKPTYDASTTTLVFGAASSNSEPQTGG